MVQITKGFYALIAWTLPLNGYKMTFTNGFVEREVCALKILERR